MKDENISFFLNDEQFKRFMKDHFKGIEKYLMQKAIETFTEWEKQLKWQEMENKKWLTSDEAAYYLNIKVSYLRFLVNKKKIEYRKFAGKLEFDIKVLKSYREENSILFKSVDSDI